MKRKAPTLISLVTPAAISEPNKSCELANLDSHRIDVARFLRSGVVRFCIAGFAVFAAASVMSACVSVNIGPKAGQKSSEVKFTAPPAPFEAIGNVAADGAWQNKKNGNTISFYSVCSDPADPAIDVVMRDLFAELNDLKTVHTANRTFDGREALDTEVEGRLDGVPTRIHAIVYKKNSCTYTVSYIGIPKSFEEDRGRFTNFLGNFRAQ